MRELRICINIVHNSDNGDNGSIDQALGEPFSFLFSKRNKGSEDLKETLIPAY